MKLWILILLTLVLIGAVIALAMLSIAVIVWGFQVSAAHGLVLAVLFEVLPFVIVIAAVAHLAGAL